MPEFETVSLEEARAQGKYITEYVAYLHQIPEGQGGKFRLLEHENSITIRKRLGLAAEALGINLVIKRSGQDVYFWIEPPPVAEEQLKRRLGRRPKTQEETPTQEQPFREPEVPTTENAPDLVARLEPESYRNSVDEPS